MKKSCLAAYLLLSMLVGCGNVAAPSETTLPDSSAEMSEETTDDGPVIPEGTDYGGYEFRVLARGAGKWTCVDMYTEEEVGEALNDAVYKRNLYVSDKLNVTFSQNTIASDDDLASQAQKSISAGDDDFDIVWMGSQKLTSLTLSHLFADLNTIGLDLSNNWWDQKAVENLTINGKTFMTTGDISVIGNYATYVMAFNKTLHEQYGLDDVYSLVREGKWTFDAFAGMARQVSEDLNGNGKYDKDDRFGFMTYGSDYTGFMFACGGSFSVPEGDTLVTNYSSERVISQLNDLAELHRDNSTFFFPNDEVANKIFLEGRTLFSFRTLINLNFYRDMETDYGILPMPKYDENQEEYHCGVHAYGLSLISVPVTATDPGRTAMILELMGYKSKELLTPAFYEKTLKGKYFRDEESGEMLDIIFSSRVYDIGYYSNWGNLHTRLEGMSQGAKSDFASVFESTRTKVEDSLAKTIEAYT